MSVPWYMLSPSPITFIQWGVLTWIMWGYFSRAVEYKKLPRLMSLLDALFVVAFFVVLTDSFWALFTLLKWLPLHPGDFVQIGSSFLRDLIGALLFYLFIGGYFKQHTLSLDRSVIFWLLVCFFSQAAWFLLAPSPGFTDYRYAWRHGSDIGIIIGSFLFSQFVMRIPLWITILKTRMEFYR